MGSMMQHIEKEISTDAAVIVVVSWAAVQVASAQWMKGSRPSISSAKDRYCGSM